MNVTLLKHILQFRESNAKKKVMFIDDDKMKIHSNINLSRRKNSRIFFNLFFVLFLSLYDCVNEGKC